MKAKEINSKRSLLNDNQLKNVIKQEVNKKLKGIDQLKADMRSSM